MKQNVGKAVKIAVLTVGAFVMIFPFLWMLFTSLKTLPESISIPPTLFPAVPQFENYTEALAVAPFGLYLRNSIIVAGGGTLLTLVLTVLSAYGFTIYEFRGKKLLFLLCLSTMMIPAELLIIQNFITISKLGWMDTFQGIILPTVALTGVVAHDALGALKDDVGAAAGGDGGGELLVAVLIVDRGDGDLDVGVGLVESGDQGIPVGGLGEAADVEGPQADLSGAAGGGAR